MNGMDSLSWLLLKKKTLTSNFSDSRQQCASVLTVCDAERHKLLQEMLHEDVCTP